MNRQQADLQGYILLSMRLLMAFIFLWHGVPKAIYIGWSMEKFVGFGLPGFFGPIVGWAEVVASIALIVGIWHKWANLLLALIIVVAIITVQLPKGGVTAGLERDLLILAGTLALAIFGPGAMAVESSRSEDSATLATSNT